jgi:membrane associated rhomboid family serine protease
LRDCRITGGYKLQANAHILLYWVPLLRRLEPFTLGLVLLCVAWTGLAWALHWTYPGAGALNRTTLWQGEYGRAFTTILLHGSWWHLALNGLSLYMVGQAVARGCGRGVLLVCVLLGSWAGLGASLLAGGHDHWRVGISGGVFALLGLVVAVEWAISDSFRSFLKQTNTRLVLFFLVLNVGLALWFESRYPGLIDHWGHGGGLAFGLLFGLVRYARPSRIRLVPGAVAAVLLGAGPLAAAAYPLWNADFFVERARAAEARRDGDAAADAWARVLRLRPGDADAGVHLALLRDDPSFLASLRPASPQQFAAVVEAHLELARRRLEDDPEGARGLMDSALAMPGLPHLWLEFGHAAHRAGREELFVPALERALGGLDGSEKWRAAGPLLPVRSEGLREEGVAPEELLRRAIADAALGTHAAGGLAEGTPLDEAQRSALEHHVALLGTQLLAAARTLEAGVPRDQLRPLAAALSELFLRLADNTAGERTPAYRLEAAVLLAWEQQGRETAEAEDERLRGLFKGALREARERGDPRVEAAAARWFRSRGLEVPPPELAEPPGGG